MLKQSRLAVDTGTPRSVKGHIVSGAIASLTVASAINFDKYKKEEITKCEAVRNTLKLTLQGSIATSSAIASANFLGPGAILKMLGTVGVGIVGIYAIEKIDEKLEQQASCNLLENSCEEIELIEEKGE